ncbi:MAG: hypothetical protein HY731_01975, partial [Candidatus Tectomicrobia bacterium]|nr:hypothetical protein [Candidatus Tectomicrobia bacterium]
ELVGEITDEYDDIEEPLKILGENTFRVSGKFSLEDLNMLLQADFPPHEFDTVGGYVFHLFGKLPERGEVVRHGKIPFTVEKMKGTRILEVTVQVEEP